MPGALHAEIGSACRATSECAEGTHCVANVCREASFIAPSKEEPPITPWFRGAHGYLGATIGYGMSAPTGGIGQVALRGGLMYSGLQLLLEVSPGSTVFGLAQFGGFDVTGSVGGVIPLSRMFAWILRLGGGAGFIYGDNCCNYGAQKERASAFGEFRADLFTVAIRPSDHLVIELALPSFRLAAGHYLATSEFIGMWLAALTVEYVF